MRTLALMCVLTVFGLHAVGEQPAAKGVVFDFNVPAQVRDVDFACKVEFATGGGKPYRYDLKGARPEAEDLAFAFHNNVKGSGIRAEIVNKTQVRVLGIEKGGKFYPAIKGTVTSKTLPADALPKVTNPPKA